MKIGDQLEYAARIGSRRKHGTKLIIRGDLIRRRLRKSVFGVDQLGQLAASVALRVVGYFGVQKVLPRFVQRHESGLACTVS